MPNRLRFALAAATAALLVSSAGAQLRISVQPEEFRITVFAKGLNYPLGMVLLDDGSVLVAVTNGSSFFGSTSGSIVRLEDSDGDGVADSQTILADDVPVGGPTALKRAGDLIFTTGQGSSKPIVIYRLGPAPTYELTEAGRIVLNYVDFYHPHSALGVRPTPGQPGSYDLLFQLGSGANFATTTATGTLTSTIGVSGVLNGDALHMVTITDTGTEVTGSNLIQIATGLRNAAGYAFHPETGDLYLQDNGIDGLSNSGEAHSADELNVIPADQIGGEIEDFGFPDSYVEYRTGNTIGGQGIPPLVAFLPLPEPQNGSESEGPNDIAFAPPGFPQGFNKGMFVTFHGQFNQAGPENEENPLVYVDLESGEYVHFVSNELPGIGHLDGLLASGDKLYVSDISPRGNFGSSAANTGVIYQIGLSVLTGTWEHTLPDSVLSGALLEIEATVHLRRFLTDLESPRLTMDLSAFGGPAAVPLVAVGDSTYRVESTLLVDVPNGLLPVLIRIEQGPNSTELVKNLRVLPVDQVIFDEAATGDWPVEIGRNIEAADLSATDVVHSGGISGVFQVKESFAGWSVTFRPATPVDPLGYRLRFALRPGEIEELQSSARFTVAVTPGKGVSLLAGERLDVARQEWQIVEIPMDAFDLEAPIEAVVFAGNFGGTFYLDDIRLVTGAPQPPRTAVVESQEATIPQSFTLSQNYPNPFNPETTIHFDLPQAVEIELALYNLTGQKVATLAHGRREAGTYSLLWNGRDEDGRELASSVYLYRLQAGSQLETRKLLLLR